MYERGGDIYIEREREQERQRGICVLKRPS